jgi:hypothetical protein
MGAIFHGPTGKLIEGHVLDVNKSRFEETLKFYDPRLYVRWNPRKLHGWGCWEIRRHPSKKTVVYQGTHEGVAYSSLMSVEIDHVHHVLDAAFLNYDALRKLKEMDVWENPEFITDMDYREEQYALEQREKAKKEMEAQARDNATGLREFVESIRSGVDPSRILTSIPWVMK